MEEATSLGQSWTLFLAAGRCRQRASVGLPAARSQSRGLKTTLTRTRGSRLAEINLKPYFERAANILNLGPILYDEEMWALIGSNVKRPLVKP
jgi:hypothetical protein